MPNSWRFAFGASRDRRCCGWHGCPKGNFFLERFRGMEAVLILFQHLQRFGALGYVNFFHCRLRCCVKIPDDVRRWSFRSLRCPVEWKINTEQERLGASLQSLGSGTVAPNIIGWYLSKERAASIEGIERFHACVFEQWDCIVGSHINCWNDWNKDAMLDWIPCRRLQQIRIGKRRVLDVVQHSVDTCLWKKNSQKLSEDLPLNLPCCFPCYSFSWRPRYPKLWSGNCIASGIWLKSAVNIIDFWRMMAFLYCLCNAFRKHIKHLQWICMGPRVPSRSITIVFTFLCKRKKCTSAYFVFNLV